MFVMLGLGRIGFRNFYRLSVIIRGGFIFLGLEEARWIVF